MKLTRKMEFPHQGYYSATKQEITKSAGFHDVAQLLHWDREGDSYGETGLLLTHLLSLLKGAGTMI